MADSETERRGETDDGKATSDVEVLRSGREEARVVLDHQLQLLNETHAKAIRTVRITGVIFGLVISAAALPGASQFVNAFTIGGVGSLVLSVLLGLVTYSAFNPEFGVGAKYLHDVQVGSYTESEWFGTLLGGYREWISDMEHLNDRNSRLLVLTQLFLGLGILLLTTGVAVATFVS